MDTFARPDTFRSESQGNSETHDLSKFWEVEDASVHFQHKCQIGLHRLLTFGVRSYKPLPPIIYCIENGYCILPKFVPSFYSQQNHKSMELYSEFVNDAVQKLITN